MLAHIKKTQGRLDTVLAAVEKASKMDLVDLMDSDSRHRKDADYLLMLEIHKVRGKLPRQV